MTQCCAPGCKNKGRHIFPKDLKRRKAWEKALRIKNFKATKHSALCSAHFKADDYFGQSKYNVYEPQARFLKRTAVPSIFSFKKSKLESSSAKERLENLVIKRSRRKLMRDVTSLPTSSQESNETCLPISSLSMDTESCNEVEISTESEEISLSASPAEHVFLSKGTQIQIENMFGTINRYKSDDKGI